MKFNYSKFEDALDIMLAQDFIWSWQSNTAGHYRINDVLDVWPRRQKFHNIETDKYGQYQKLDRLIVESFK